MNQDEVERLQTLFKSHPQVEAAYLFGSQARGTANRFSDLDLAVLLKDASSTAAVKMDLLAGLAADGFCEVDLVVLNEAPPLLRFEAVKHNELLFARAGFDAAGYFSRCILEYLDFAPFLDCQYRYFQRHLQHGILTEAPHG